MPIIATGDITDTVVILLGVVINTAVGATQEHRAIHAVAVLRQLAAPSARTLRDGATARVPTRDLVPGDVVLLAATDSVGLRTQLSGCCGRSSPWSRMVAPNTATCVRRCICSLASSRDT